MLCEELRKRVLLLDGAMGTMLTHCGRSDGLNLSCPSAVGMLTASIWKRGQILSQPTHSQAFAWTVVTQTECGHRTLRGRKSPVQRRIA